MVTTGERSVSGRAVVAGGLAVVVVIVVVSVAFGPALRERVRQDTSPRTLREPVASGQHDGDVWEAVARYDGNANCVELRYRAEVLGRACDTGPQRAVTRLPSEGPVVAYGVADEDAEQVEVPLDDGSTAVAPVVAGDLGFPVGFWALELPSGTVPATESP